MTTFENLSREDAIALQNLADAEWDRVQRTGVTSPEKCPDCGHRVFEHTRIDAARVARGCVDCTCDRYARVF